MRREELATLTTPPPPEPTIRAEDLTGPDRTLLWGYDVDKVGMHVYLLDGQIHLARISLGRILSDQAEPVWPAKELVPNKRAYPERTDIAFARLMIARDAEICFTTFDDAAWLASNEHRFHAPVVGQVPCVMCGQAVTWDTDHKPAAWRHTESESSWCAEGGPCAHP